MKSFAAPRYVKGKNVAKKPRKYKNVGGVRSKSSSSKSSSSKSSGSKSSGSKSSGSKSSGSKSSGSKSSDASQISKEENILFRIGNDFSYLIDNYEKLFRKDAIINKFMVIDLLRLTKEQSILIKKKIDKIFVKINKSSLIYVDDTSYDVFRAKHDKLFAQLEKITDGFIGQYKDTTHKKVVIYNIGLRNIFIILFEILKIFFEYMETDVKIYGGISNEDMRYVNGYIKDEVEICYNELLEYDIYDIKEFIKQEKGETFEKFYASVLVARQRKDEERFYSLGKKRTYNTQRR
jgi:hypothetical protein